MIDYPLRYSWSHPLGEDALAHTDGSVSMLVVWRGLDVELATGAEQAATWQRFYRLLHELAPGTCYEFHLWRESDDSIARAYLDKGQDMVRGQAFAAPLREAHAAHLARYARANRVGVIIKSLATQRFYFGAKRALKQLSARATTLRESAARLVQELPGGYVASTDEYLGAIQQTYYRPAFYEGETPMYDPQFSVAEQLIRARPEFDAGHQLYHIGGVYHKVLYAFLYPDAAPAWSLALAEQPCDLHISHVVIPVDTASAMKAAERETIRAEGMMSRQGEDYARKHIRDLAAFRKFVADNDLAIFKNAFFLHLSHPDPRQVNERARSLAKLFEPGGQVRSDHYMQLALLRYVQPGEGSRCPLLRADHTLQVANMLPVHVFDTGTQDAEMLRMTSSTTLVGINHSTREIPHSITVAKTGAGKGVDKVNMIVDTYPFGIDWYICEVGGSYRWTVEAFDGNYIHADADTVINPFPTFDMADVSGATTYPLNTQLTSATVQALAFLLLDGRTELDVHSEAAAQMALQMLYAAPVAGRIAPTLEDYYNEITSATYWENEQQAQAAKRMSGNLHSFLSTSQGQVFSSQDNLVLTPGITGVDLKGVMQISDKLFKYFLVFISLRFAQLAFFASRNASRVLLDEMHVMVDKAPDVIGPLCKALARMGRKDNAAIDLVTQGIEEIDRIEREVLNSCSIKNVLYRPDGHDDIASRIAMPAGGLAAWRGYPDFESLPGYRQGVLVLGERAYDLHLTFPQALLDLAGTGKGEGAGLSDLDIKDEIGALTRDPHERLRLFRERKSANKNRGQHAA